MIAFFETLVTKFPINPLKVYSAPSTPAAVDPMVALHAENLQITENVTKEPIGVGFLHHPTTEECINNLGFNPMMPPPEEI